MSREDLIKLAVLSVLDKSNTVADFLRHLMKDSEAKNMLIELEYLNMGIIPARSTFEIKQHLSRLPYEDGRRLKRKFRKIHRKLRKQLENSNQLRFGTEVSQIIGMRGSPPDRFQKSNRKYIVFKEIRDRLNGKKSL